MGAILGYAYLWSRSIWVPIFAHFVNNATAVVLAYLAQRNIIPSDTENIGANPGETALIVMSIVMVAGFLMSLYRREKSNIILYPDEEGEQ